MDQITINNLEIFAHHGVFPEETKLGQKFLFTVTLYLDTREAGLTDDLDKSVNYGSVSHFIKEENEAHTFRLLETAAEHMASKLLTFDERIRKVDLEIRKPWAPIGLPLETVSVKITRSWHDAWIAFGSNMGDRKDYIETALEELKHSDRCEVTEISTIIETEPYGVTDQDCFLNGALKMRTLLTPEELLVRLHEIEQNAGRERLIHWGPRTLDLDIIFYDDEIIEKADLCVPHVDMQNRLFVLEPLCEISPYKRHPVYGKTIYEMLEELKKKD